MTSWVSSYLSYMESLTQNSVVQFAERKLKIRLPKLTLNMLTSLTTEARKILETESTVFRISTDVKSVLIVGDIHGHLLDLLLIFKTHGFPRNQRYLFLGDLVDRGEFSLETIVLVLALKICFPENVFIIRGNHEFSEMFETSGFGAELSAEYNSNKSVVSMFSNVFSFLPLACVIDDKYFCVHGGIGPSFSTIHEIEKIRNPCPCIDCNSIVTELLWSDPSDSIPFFMPSSRGTGFLFGAKALERFFKDNGFEKVIRAHQCVKEGILHSMNNSVITVFSASNYCGITYNKGGVLLISSAGIEEYTYGPLQYLKRESAIIVENESDTEFIPPTKKGFLTTIEPKQFHSLSVEKQERLPLLNSKTTPYGKSRKSSLPVATRVPFNPLSRMHKGNASKSTSRCGEEVFNSTRKVRQSSSIRSLPRTCMLQL